MGLAIFIVNIVIDFEGGGRLIRPFNTLQFYLAANFIPPFVGGLLFFLFFLLTGQLFRLIRIVVNKDVAFSVVLELILHTMISFLPMAVPLSIFFAALYCLGKLSEDSEIIAMRSFGLTRNQFARPFLLLGLVIAVALFSLGRNLIPHSKALFKNTIIRLTSRGMLANIKSGVFFTEIPRVVLFADEVSNGGDDLSRVFIHYTDEEEDERVIMAKEGKLIRQYFSETQTPTFRLRLKDGNMIKYAKNHGDMDKILFESHDFPLAEGGEQMGFVTRDGMRSNSALSAHIEKHKRELDELLKIGKKSDKQRHRIRAIETILPRAQIEYWSRFNTPLLCLVFILLGVGLGIKGGRGRERHSSVIGGGLVAAYYALFLGGFPWPNRVLFHRPSPSFCLRVL